MLFSPSAHELYIYIYIYIYIVIYKQEYFDEGKAG
jgi:hypothetical protein